MENNRVAYYKVPMSEHPMWLVLWPALYLASAVAEAWDYGDAPEQVLWSVLLGLLIGLPVVLSIKKDIGRNLDLHAELAIRPLDPAQRKLRLRIGLRHGLPVLLAQIACFLLHELLRIPNRSGLLIPMALIILLYHLAQETFKLAQHKVHERNSVNGRDGR